MFLQSNDPPEAGPRCHSELSRSPKSISTSKQINNVIKFTVQVNNSDPPPTFFVGLRAPWKIHGKSIHGKSLEIQQKKQKTTTNKEMSNNNDFGRF